MLKVINRMKPDDSSNTYVMMEFHFSSLLKDAEMSFSCPFGYISARKGFLKKKKSLDLTASKSLNIAIHMDIWILAYIYQVCVMKLYVKKKIELCAKRKFL